MEKREGGKEEEEKGDVITNVKDLFTWVPPSIFLGGGVGSTRL